MGHFRLAILCILALAPGKVLPEEAPYYMWTDDDGILNFSQIRPRDTEATEISNPVPFGRRRSQESPEESPDEITDIEKPPPLELPAFTPPTELSSEAITKANVIVRQRNCLSARRTLETLQTSKEIIIRGDDGFWREVDDEVRQQEIQKAKTVIKENCQDTHQPLVR